VGHDFRPDYANVGKMRALINNPPTIALTATATEDVRADIIHLLKLREPSIVITGFDRTNLRYECQSFDKKAIKDSSWRNSSRIRTAAGLSTAQPAKPSDAVAAMLSAQLPGRAVLRYHAGWIRRNAPPTRNNG